MTSAVDDPILSDLFRFREQHAAAFNSDIAAMMEDLIREQSELEKQGRRFVSYPPRRCQREFPFTPIETEPTAVSPYIETAPLTCKNTASTQL